MKLWKWIIAVFFPLIICNKAFGQELPENTKQQLENLAEALEEEPENDEFLQQLYYLRKEPVNLNTADVEALQAFPFLTDLQIESLVQYRRLFGNLINIYELQAIPSWDLITIHKILPYVKLEHLTSAKEILSQRFMGGEHLLLARSSRIFEKSQGYTISSQYLGDRNHHLLRYRYQYKNLLQYGITADKDAGELFLKKNKGFDFYSYHFFARNVGLFKNIAIGDYTLNLGQGLIHWQALAFKKGSEVMNIKRQAAIIKPYSSAGEFYFNRGAATTIEKENWQATFFLSVRKISTNIDSINGEEISTSFQTSGLHRTSSEIEERNKLQQTSFGGNISYYYQAMKFGINAVQYHFSMPFQKRDEPYNLFSWHGRSWRNFSFDYSTTYRNVHFFGEAAVDKNLHKAFVNGALISVDPKVDFSLLHRSISKDYQAIYGNAFTENVQPVNETGIYAGISLRPLNFLRLNAYVDVYKFSWLKYRVDAPSAGKDFLAQITYQPNKLFEIYSRYRYESKGINEVSSSALNYIAAKPKQNWRLHYSYALSPKTLFRSRTEILWYDKKGSTAENGFLIFGELHYKLINTLSGSFRFSYFETEGYNSRIYAYENDLLYNYSIPALFGKGKRYYLNINYDVNASLSFWLKLSQTYYKDKSLIGSGLNEIQGNKLSEGKLQFIYKF